MSNRNTSLLLLVMSIIPTALLYFSYKEVKRTKEMRTQLNENGIKSYATIVSLEKNTSFSITPTNFGNPIRKTEYMMRCTYFNADKPIDFSVSFNDALTAALKGEKYHVDKEERGASSYEQVYFSLGEKDFRTFHEGQKIPIKYIYGIPDSATRIDENDQPYLANLTWTIYLWGFLLIGSLVVSFLYSKGIRV